MFALFPFHTPPTPAKAQRQFHTDIHQASWQGDVQLVRSFLDAERRLVNSADETDYGEGWTPLHYAAYRGHLEVVQVLLSAGASVNSVNAFNFTPLYYGAQQGRKEVCNALMEYGADVSIYGWVPDEAGREEGG
ncbi:ankyrin repeat domain-containing protein, partial [archaeon]